jgi:hypothetical protein
MEWSVTSEGGISQQAAGDLRITVLFTDLKRTKVALRSALKLAQNLDASFQMLVMRVVPYPLPLDRPPVDPAFIEKQISVLLSEFPIQCSVRICECRDVATALLQILPPESVIVAGFRNTWWPSSEKRLARKLQKAGHNVCMD